MTGNNKFLSNGEIAHKSLKHLFVSSSRGKIRDFAALEINVFLHELKAGQISTGSITSSSRNQFLKTAFQLQYQRGKISFLQGEKDWGNSDPE